MRRTGSAPSARDIPAAVMNSGRAEDPRMTGTAWVAVRNLGLGQADHRDAELGVRVRARAGSATRVQIGVAVDHEQAPAGVRTCGRYWPPAVSASSAPCDGGGDRRLIGDDGAVGSRYRAVGNRRRVPLV